MSESNVKSLRRIIINSTQETEFPCNNIKTAKYNIITFLPLSIINQFNNYFNVFFLVTAIILAIPVISPMDPASAITPFLFVMFISIVREGLEDHKKAKYDKTYNNSLSLQYNKNSNEIFDSIKWKDIQVGKLVKVLKNEVIPADLLVVKSSSENGFCYLQTTNLDGESALKPREAMIIFQDILKSDNEIDLIFNGVIDVDPPDKNIYKVEGSAKLEGHEKYFFDINNILLRGGTLKNVEYIYGIVLYTGKDTKIMKNIKHGSLKQSSIESKLNRIVIYIMIITFLICFLCTAFGVIYMKSFKANADYLYQLTNIEKSNDFLEIMKIFAAFFTIFNTLIPISVMITLQVVKGLQILLIEKDPLLKQNPDEKLKVLSMKLHEDLGNVKYIFTDKTGTLTRNEMEFKACSIFTRLYDEEKDNGTETNLSYSKKKTVNEISKEGSQGLYSKGGTINPTKKSIFSDKFDTMFLRDSLQIDQPIEIVDLGDTPFVSMKDAIMEFFLNIAINHNVLTEVDSQKNEKEYTGSNPDEVVLVQAAKELGIEFIERSNKYSKIKIFNQEYLFEILHRFDYSSARMRSSIIVKDQYGVIKLYMKGADSIILKKIDTYSQNFLFKSTKEHLEFFAKKGLRTLCFSVKTIDPVELKNWEINYKAMQDIAVKDKSMAIKLEETIAELEDNMLLIGVSALEDKLQDNVKEVLQDFIEAGINVWMLTGDKLDTAESIGYSCKLFNDDTEIFKIKAGKDKSETMQRVQSILEKMQILEKQLFEFKFEKRRKKRSGEKIIKKKKKPEYLLLNKNIGDNQHNLDNNFLNMNNIDVNGLYKINSCSFNQKPNDIDFSNSPKSIKSNINKIKITPRNENNNGNNAIKLKRIHSQLPATAAQIFDSNGLSVNINEINNQIKNENIEFIGSKLDRKSNLITLNFLKKGNADLKLKAANSSRLKKRPNF